MPMPAVHATLIDCLTHPGNGAIATLALRGPEAWSSVRALWHAPLPPEPGTDKFYLGRLGEDATLCDAVVLAARQGEIELHCHGGVEVVRYVQELFAARGARVCSPRELAGGGSRIHRLAVEQLMQAP